MWRFILLATLGLVIGSKARSERGVIVLSVLLGLVYGGVEVIVTTLTGAGPSLERALFLLGLGLVLAAPVYAIAELWRRARTRAKGWLRRLRRR